MGDDGTTWIELRHEAEGAPYLVVDRSGDVVGSFVLAESNRLGAVPSVSEVWVVEPNELDVEDIVKYRIIW